MAVWDELRAVLLELWNHQPGPLRQFPHPREEEGQPPPYQITVVAWAVAVAEDLHRRFGDCVRLTVGRLPYPPGSEPGIPLTDLARPPRGDPLDPEQAQLELDGPATVPASPCPRRAARSSISAYSSPSGIIARTPPRSIAGRGRRRPRSTGRSSVSGAPCYQTQVRAVPQSASAATQHASPETPSTAR